MGQEQQRQDEAFCHSQRIEAIQIGICRMGWYALDRQKSEQDRKRIARKDAGKRDTAPAGKTEIFDARGRAAMKD